MDCCDAPRFSNSSMQKSSCQGWRHPVELESKQANDIVMLLRDNVLDQLLRLEDSWRIDKICLVNNKTSEENFLKKKYELSRVSTVTYAFGVAQTEQDADRICGSCDFTCQSLNVPLGDVNQGVNVCLFSDVLLQWSEKKDFRRPCIIIYKIVKGRCKAVAPRTSTKDPYETPTPNMECHISRGTPNASEPIFRQLSKSQIFLFECDKAAVPSRRPRHCLPYATISLTSKTEKFGEEKENGNVIVPIKAWEEPPRQEPTQGTRMKLSDRFSNIAPSHSKLDDPKLEELRQAHLKKLAKLEAVRNERYNNALLGFGSSSEDELLQSSPKPLGTGKTTERHKGLFSCSTSNVAQSGIGHLKVTITNTGSLSENSDDGTGGKTTKQNEKNTKHCEAKPSTKERHDRFKDNSSSKEKLTEKRAHSNDSRSSRCHPKSKVLKLSEDCPSYQSRSSPKTDKGSRCYKTANAGDGGSQGQSRGARRGVSSHSSGYSRGRGRVRYRCPEYFKSDDESRAFDAEKVLYEAASSRSSKPQGTDVANATYQSHTLENKEIRNTSYKRTQMDVPFIRLESRNSYNGKDSDFSIRQHDTCNTSALPNLDSYSKSLQFEPISPDDHLPDSRVATNADNLEVLDMEIDESSRESWQQETKQNCRQRSSCETWADSQASAIQTRATSPVRDIPASVQQNSASAPVSRDAFMQPNHSTNNPACASIGPHTESLVTSSPIQEAVKMLEEQIQQAKTADQKEVFQLALQSFLEKCASEQGSCCPTTSAQGFTDSCTQNTPTNTVSSSPTHVAPCSPTNVDSVATDVTIQEGATEIKLVTCKMEQKPCDEKVTSGRKEKETKKSDPRKPKTKKMFHGRPMLVKGKPHEILMENIPGKHQPVDPRPALSEWVDRRYEVDLKELSWNLDENESKSSEGHQDGAGSSKAVRSRRKSKGASPTDKESKVERPKSEQGTDLPVSSLDKNESKSSKRQQDGDGTSNAERSKQKSNEASSPTYKDPVLERSPKSDQEVDLPVPKLPVQESDIPKCDLVNLQTAKLAQPDSVQKLADVKKEDGNTKQKQIESNPTKQFLQKLQHVSCLATSATKPDLKGKPESTSQESAAKELEVPVKHIKPSREAEKSGRRISGSSSCSTDSPVSVCFSPEQVLFPEKTSGKRTHRRERSPRRSGSDDSLHRKRSPHRRKSSHRYRSRSRSRSPRRHRSSHRRRSSEHPSCRRREDRPRLYSEGTKSSYCGTFSTQPTGKLFLSNITSELSSLQSSTHKATEKMSKFSTDRKQFKQECFSCLDQYNQLWLKATKALSTLKQNASSTEFEIQKHEDVAANIHLQLESLAKYFHQNDLEKAGIEDWNFRPLSGVPGLSEIEHLTVLCRLKEKYVQPGSDLMRLLCQKMHLLETKLASRSPSFDRVLGKSQFQPPVDVLRASSHSSVHLHHSAIFGKDGQKPRPIETVVSSRLESHTVSQSSDHGVRQVVLRDIKGEAEAGGEQWGRSLPNPTPQSRWCAIVKQGVMDLDKRA